MDKRQRIAQQRAKAREALGLLRAATELFATEDGAVAGDDPGFDEWVAKIDEFERWIFAESVIA